LPVYPGDVLEIEATVKRLRSRWGQLDGCARVNGRIVVDGTMTFALGSAPSTMQVRGEKLEIEK
jgi:3-hydroxymyristoyl/3-hydroxydecanoyl-(acyl carrier protein) dehydratase